MEKEEEDDDGGGGRMLLVDRSSRHLFTNWSLEVWRDRYVHRGDGVYLSTYCVGERWRLGWEVGRRVGKSVVTHYFFNPHDFINTPWVVLVAY